VILVLKPGACAPSVLIAIITINFNGVINKAIILLFFNTDEYGFQLSNGVRASI
jgi:hypothetical protein